MKYSFKLVSFSKSYARKHKWVFFSEHSVLVILVMHDPGKQLVSDVNISDIW